MQQFLEVGYSLSNRVRCSKCYQVIEKDDIRIGHVFVAQVYGYNKKDWYHLMCLKAMPKGDGNRDLDFINIHNLKQQDQKKVKLHLEEIKKNGKKFVKVNKLENKQEELCDYVKAPKDIFSTFVKHMKHKERKDLSEF